MDSNQKPRSSPPPPMPPPPPPKNGRGRPPLVSMKQHDEGDGSAVGVGDMEGVALRHGSPYASHPKLSGSRRPELFGSSRHELFGSGHCLEGKASPRSLVDSPNRDEPTAEQHGLPRRYSRVAARLKNAGPGTIAVVDDQPYTCADCSMIFGRESALCGHMRLHKCDHLSSDSEEDARTPKRRTKKQKSILRTAMPLEAKWGNHAPRNGIPRDAPAEVKLSRSESNGTVPNIAAAMHDNNEVTENNHNSDDISVEDDDDDANPVITVTGSHGAPGLAPDAAAALAMATAPAVAAPTPRPAAHATTTCVNTEGAPASMSATHQALGGHITSHHRITQKKGKAVAVAASAAASKESNFEVSGINNIGAAVDGPYNTMGWRIPAGAPRRAILALPAPMAPVHGQQPQGAMATAPALVVPTPTPAPHSAATSVNTEGAHAATAAVTVTIPLAPASAASTHQVLGGHVTSHQRITEKNGKAIAAASKEKIFEVARINNIGAAVDGPYNTMGWRIPAGAPRTRSAILALPASMAQVHQPPQGTMAMAGNPMTSYLSAASTSTGWSLLGITSSMLPTEHIASVAAGNHRDCSISPELFSFSRRQDIAVVPGNAIASSSSTPRPGIATVIDAPANTMDRRMPFFLTGRSAMDAPPMLMPVHQPTQGMAAMAGNPVTGHLPAAMAGNWYSFPATTSSVLPAIPLQTQEENPPQGRVVLMNELADPSQNQVENQWEQTVPSNNGGRTIRLFGKNIAEGQKEVKD